MVVALVVFGSACLPEASPTLTFNGNDSYNTTVLTPDGNDAYSFVAEGSKMMVAPLAYNSGGNLRTAFWPLNGPSVADGQTCATWIDQAGTIVQQGAALRIRTTDGWVRAITVTKNIYYGANWIFNFHTWDNSRVIPYSQFGSTTLEGMKGRPLPWRFCARVLGSRVEFKVWPLAEAEPPWGTTSRGGSATLPAGWSDPGRAGWYIGHLEPSGSARFEDLGAWAYNWTPPTTTTAPKARSSTVAGTTTTAPSAATASGDPGLVPTPSPGEVAIVPQA